MIRRLIILLLIVGCAVAPLTEKQKVYQKVVETNGASNEIFAKSLEWASAKFPGGAIFDKSDKESQIIWAHGSLKIFYFPVLQVKYQCKIVAKDNYAWVTFSNFQYWFDAGVNMRNSTEIQPKMLLKIHPELDKLITDLENNLKSASTDSDW